MLLGVEDPISGDELEIDQNVTYSQILTGSQIVSADVSWWSKLRIKGAGWF